MVGEPLIEWIEVTIDCADVGAVAEFWRELLGLARREDPLPGWMRAASSVPGGPDLTFQPVPEPKVGTSGSDLARRQRRPATSVGVRRSQAASSPEMTSRDSDNATTAGQPPADQAWPARFPKTEEPR